MSRELRVQSREPVFNVPASIVWMLGVLGLVHAVRGLLTNAQDAWVVLSMGFIPARYSELGIELPGGKIAAVTSFVTHMLLHGDLAHLLINGAWLLAVGSVIARRVGTMRTVALTVVCGIAGALAFLAVNPGLATPVVGASGAISGLMGAVFRLIFGADNFSDRLLLREEPWKVPRLGLLATFTDRRSLMAIGLWVVINLVFAYWLGGLLTEGGVAWEAHIGGFFAGLLAFDAFDTGPVRHARAEAGEGDGGPFA
jgi:membrane associated rhomboid family serine protease